jgi:hypothetical protein
MKVLQRLLAGIFVAGALGLLAELFLIGHLEDVWQGIPFLLLALSLVALAWNAIRREAASGYLFLGTSLLLIAGGVAGIVLHYRSNTEFELEMSPSLAGWPLVREALTGALPALAPGALVQLGLIGVAYWYGGARLRAPVYGQENTI